MPSQDLEGCGLHVPLSDCLLAACTGIVHGVAPCSTGINLDMCVGVLEAAALSGRVMRIRLVCSSSLAEMGRVSGSRPDSSQLIPHNNQRYVQKLVRCTAAVRCTHCWPSVC